MMGHRGVRLGITHPEITEMQARAILESASELTAEKVVTFPEIMIPLTGMETEYYHQEKNVRDVAAKIDGLDNYMDGTMMEIRSRKDKLMRKRVLNYRSNFVQN